MLWHPIITVIFSWPDMPRTSFRDPQWPFMGSKSSWLNSASKNNGRHIHFISIGCTCSEIWHYFKIDLLGKNFKRPPIIYLFNRYVWRCSNVCRLCRGIANFVRTFQLSHWWDPTAPWRGDTTFVEIKWVWTHKGSLKVNFLDMSN